MNPEDDETYHAKGLTAKFVVFVTLIVKTKYFEVEFNINDVIASSEESFLHLHKHATSKL